MLEICCEIRRRLSGVMLRNTPEIMLEICCEIRRRLSGDMLRNTPEIFWRFAAKYAGDCLEICCEIRRRLSGDLLRNTPEIVWRFALRSMLESLDIGWILVGELSGDGLEIGLSFSGDLLLKNIKGYGNAGDCLEICFRRMIEEIVWRFALEECSRLSGDLL